MEKHQQKISWLLNIVKIVLAKTIIMVITIDISEKAPVLTF